MNILGIAGSPRPEEISGVHALVKTVLEHTRADFELISLQGKRIFGCTACLGCVQDNVCKLEDDLTPLRDRILAADAYVIGAPNYFGTINATTHALLERWFQFRHQSGSALWGKLAVTIGVGGTVGGPASDALESMLQYNFIETVAKVSAQGAASCYSCGFGERCQVSIPNLLHGLGVEIHQEMIPDVARQPEVMEAAIEAGKLLGARLRDGHDRVSVTRRMQARMHGLFHASV
jgi:multimeric flavodoxin WrbA